MDDSIKWLTDDEGNRVAAVVPAEEYLKLVAGSGLYNKDAKTPPLDVVIIMQRTGCTARKAWRLHRGLTLVEVGDALGVAKQTVNGYEKGPLPKVDTLVRLAAIYRCRLEQLIFTL